MMSELKSSVSCPETCRDFFPSLHVGIGELQTEYFRLIGTSASVILFLCVHSWDGMHLCICICRRIREWNPRIHSLEFEVCVFWAARGRGMSPKLTVTTLSGMTRVCVCYEWQQVMGACSCRVRPQAYWWPPHVFMYINTQIQRPVCPLHSMGVLCVF